MQQNLISALLPDLLNFITYPENREHYTKVLTEELEKLETPDLLSHNFYWWNPEDQTLQLLPDMNLVTYESQEIQDLLHQDITLTLTGYSWAQIYFHFIEY